MATIKDVAKMAGVSMSTVSKYINGHNIRPDKRESIRAAIEALDYRANPFARNLKNPHNHSIGILLPDMTAPFFGSIITVMDRILRENGYHSLICCYGASHGLERDKLQFLINNGIDGLIYIPENLSAEEFFELTNHRHIPVIQVDRMIQGVSSDTVLVDNADAVYQAVSRLIESGHSRVAIVTGPRSVFSAKERLVGYLRALDDHNIIYDDTLVISGQNEFATGYQSFAKLMKLPDPPTAVFTTNYDITLGLITAAKDRGLHIPEELSVFGFDCVNICTMMQPPLPVIHQPETDIGRIAANYLIERLNGYEGPSRVSRLRCRIVSK